MSASFQLHVKNLRKEYGDRVVLNADGLVLDSGQIYALVGPNGSGKSTFLKVLSGVIDQTSGCIDVTGDVCRDDLVVGYMPQKSYVFCFTVRKNVALALKSSGLPADEVNSRVDAALEAVGMTELADARGNGLSGGEAQRVALARMLVRDLDVLLLDEPTASMDITGTLLVEEALVRYRERTGCLLVVATHAPSQAHRIADQAVMLSMGRIVESGPTARVLTDPESEEGRSFLSYWSVRATGWSVWVMAALSLGGGGDSLLTQFGQPGRLPPYPNWAVGESPPLPNAKCRRMDALKTAIKCGVGPIECTHH